ncbi:nitroreductase family protein [Marinobacter sp. chi1]|uniref:Nitroreductase family protein n=1 Tax=Marinobacter suaedae TaxID=3057675 RepID=A0ABT8VWD8_9GAMM|nr:nitroreductase family protein [Marinobacter sp. chi1]MDO3720307.1 nitroreductase family protein [Marinobacter sp. chi1]
MKSVVKKVLPNYLLILIRSAKLKLGFLFLALGGKSRFLASCYYLVNPKFANEHFAVLQGRKAYHDSLEEIGESCALLRRNIHRLEKGLIMRPRREVFAEGFITETVECYRNALQSKHLSESEKKWATDVLDEYFVVVGSSEEIDKARSLYSNIRNNASVIANVCGLIPANGNHFKPYSYKSLPERNVDFDELANLFIRRRSVRWYQDKHVPLELVQKAANLASLAPSACNRQPYKFAFCNDKQKAVAIAKCAGGTTGFAGNLPAIIAIVGDLSAYPFERDRHLIYIDGSLAAMQLMLALETLGLSSCSINWPEVDSSERKLRKIISLKDYERVVMLLAVGYADEQGGIPYSQKKTNHLILEDISE